MYKVLYLPLGEELQICVSDTNEIIPYNLKPWEGRVGLAMPGSKITAATPTSFKLAKFETKESAEEWVMSLINRPSCKQYKMLLEYFEIIKI